MAFSIQTEIIIEGNSKKVWEILTNFSNYPTWNPFLSRIEKINDTELRVQMASGEKFDTTIINFENFKELRWVGTLFGQAWLFRGEHYFQLSPKGKSTKFVHGEDFSGVLSIFLKSYLEKKVRQGFTRMNEALKNQAELS